MENKFLEKAENKFFRIIELFTESIAWLQIVASPFLIGVIAGVFIYFSKPTTNRLILAIIVALIGLAVGVVWATKKWRGEGTVWFMSRVVASPDLDNIKKDKPSSSTAKASQE